MCDQQAIYYKYWLEDKYLSEPSGKKDQLQKSLIWLVNHYSRNKDLGYLYSAQRPTCTENAINIKQITF